MADIIIGKTGGTAMNNSTKKIFISYSWTVQERVIELAERLIANGVDVVLDVYDLKDGNDKYAFMEQSVNDPTIDHVLIICDKTYTDKANSRTGGVGSETVIITPKIYNQSNQEKFIPVIFEKDEDGKAYCPLYIKSRIYIDLSNDTQYESEYEKLLRDIYQKPLFRKPALGIKPEWLENDTVDLSAIRDVIKQIKGYSGNNQNKADFLLRKCSDEFLIAAKQYALPECSPVDEGLLIIIDQYKNYRDLYVDYCEALIYSGLPLSDTIAHLIERLYNELHDASGRSSYSNQDFELADFIIWELFIDTAAIFIHYERFVDLRKLLICPYFLRQSYSNSKVGAFGYFKFRAHPRTIEEICKPKSSEPKRFTMSGDMLVNREKRPSLTKESISNADIVLYQLGRLLNVPSNGEWRDYWFPMTYIYHDDTQLIWQKLKSKTYCLKIAPLFDVETVEQLKAVVKDSASSREMRHRGAWEAAPEILSSVTLEEIGSMN